MDSRNQPLHFLLFPFLSQSHIIPLINLAKLIAKHGINVSFVTTPLNAQKHKPAIDLATSQNLKIQLIPIKFPSKESGLPNGCENMDASTSLESVGKFFTACSMLKSPLENLIQEMEPKPNCIISTNAVVWVKQVADEFEIPWYMFETVSCFTVFCSFLIKRNGIMEKLGSDSDPFLVPGIPHRVELTRLQIPGGVMKTDSDRGMRKFVEEIDQAKIQARGVLVNSFEELEPWYLDGYRKERGKVWSIGPLSLCNDKLFEKLEGGKGSSVDDRSCSFLRWLDSMRPKSVIYVCFGSLCRISFPQLKEIALGLELSNVPFVWIIRERDYSGELKKWFVEENFKERIGGRGLIIDGWAPQVLILSHLSVAGFLTHCGWNSTLEGICAGVPMITWPMFAEQFYNEKFIVNVLEIGVRIGVEACKNLGGEEDVEGTFVKSDQVKDAIEKLMDEGVEGNTRRKKAMELADSAKNAMEEGGSSYLNLAMLIKDVLQQSNSF